MSGPESPNQIEKQQMEESALLALADPYCYDVFELDIPTYFTLPPQNDSQREKVIAYLTKNNFPQDPEKIYEMARDLHFNHLFWTINNETNNLTDSEINIILKYWEDTHPQDDLNAVLLRDKLATELKDPKISKNLFEFLTEISTIAFDLDFDIILLNSRLEELIHGELPEIYRSDIDYLNSVIQISRKSGNKIPGGYIEIIFNESAINPDIPDYSGPEIFYTIQTGIYFLNRYQSEDMLRCVSLLLEFEKKLFPNPQDRIFTIDFNFYGGFYDLLNLSRGQNMSKNAQNIIDLVSCYSSSFSINELIYQIALDYLELGSSSDDDEKSELFDDDKCGSVNPLTDTSIRPISPYVELMKTLLKNMPDSDLPYEWSEYLDTVAIDNVTYGDIVRNHFLSNISLNLLSRRYDIPLKILDEFIQDIILNFISICDIPT